MKQEPFISTDQSNLVNLTSLNNSHHNYFPSKGKQDLGANTGVRFAPPKENDLVFNSILKK